MIRFASLLVMAIGAVACMTASGQSPSRQAYPREPSLFGFGVTIGNYYGRTGYGVFDPYGFNGNVYYPYQYGSFKAPDLLDDPYFRARHKFDSRYPGRYRTGIDPRIPHAQRYSRSSSQRSTSNPTDLVIQLKIASETLSRSLSAQQHGDAWLNYLGPQRISQYVAVGNLAAVAELIRRYDGVVANPELQSIMAVDGFAATRQLLHRYAESQRH